MVRKRLSIAGQPQSWHPSLCFNPLLLLLLLLLLVLVLSAAVLVLESARSQTPVLEVDSSGTSKPLLVIPAGFEHEHRCAEHEQVGAGVSTSRRLMQCLLFVIGGLARCRYKFSHAVRQPKSAAVAVVPGFRFPFEQSDQTSACSTRV